MPATPFKVYLLDVGPEEYGDAVLCRFGNTTVLIDGAHPGDHTGREGHPSIPDQLAELLGNEPPFAISLLVATHAHADHIGCLPRLVKDRIIAPEWALVADPRLGWGRAAGDPPDAGATDARVRQLTAAIREEIRTPRTDDGTLARFLLDAASLEQNYKMMLATLEEHGTNVVRYGRDSHTALVNAFDSIGLNIIGPSQDHLLECADVIRQQSHDAVARVNDMLRQDAALDVAAAYRQLVRSTFDALDLQRPGPAINLQSIITRFTFKNRKLLFAGDMQFADPQVSNDIIEQSVVQLRKKIKDEGPYDFVKLSHHGSDNAFSDEIFEELGATKLYGICAGEHSEKHPNRAILEVLDEHRDDIRWARTDRNGLVTITFGQGKPTVKLAKGTISDPRPNTSDISLPAVPPVRTPVSVTSTVVGGSPDIVEVHANIPHATTRVTISVDVEPGAGGEPPRRTDPRRARRDAVRLAGGRVLPELLFVTSSARLAQNIGTSESAALLDMLHASGQAVYDLPDGIGESSAAAPLVRQPLRDRRTVRGVVLVGGHDIVPAQILDCLPETLRDRLPHNDDPDEFIVWNDEVYGDRDGDELPEVPVSRIPDGKSAALLFAALQTGDGGSADARAGVRNIARPFADEIYGTLPGRAAMRVSEPTTFVDLSAGIASDRVYFMLHGDYLDSTRFWGEGTDDNIEAVNIDSIAPANGCVVFAGCCWGALTSDTPASSVTRNRPFGQKTPQSSIALNFLHKGAKAFIGCTGAHYSPLEKPYRYFGGPMHEAFWRHARGAPPSEALFHAKIEYFKGMPHGQRGTLARAIEYKMWRQYTCLGLGW